MPSPEEATAYAYSEAETARVERLRRRALFRTPDVVGGELRSLAAAHQVEEVAILTILHDQAARRRSYQLLAGEFGLRAPEIPLATD